VVPVFVKVYLLQAILFSFKYKYYEIVYCLFFF